MFYSEQLVVYVMPSQRRIVLMYNFNNKLYDQLFEEPIPIFNNTYYLGGVPQLKMPEK